VHPAIPAGSDVCGVACRPTVVVDVSTKRANSEISRRLLRNGQNVWNAQSLIRKTKTKSDGDKKYKYSNMQ